MGPPIRDKTRQSRLIRLDASEAIIISSRNSHTTGMQLTIASGAALQNFRPIRDGLIPAILIKHGTQGNICINDNVIRSNIDNSVPNNIVGSTLAQCCLHYTYKISKTLGLIGSLQLYIA